MILSPLPLGSAKFGPAPDRVRLTTWNVWFDRHQREPRFHGLLQELALWQPHLMVFQEVTMPFLRAVLACDWLRDRYWVSAQEPNQLGVLMVGRVEPQELRFEALPSDMGRRALVCELDRLSVAGCHLESTDQGGARRQQQLARCFELLRGSPRAVVMGDFNFPDGAAEAGGLDPAYRDAWGDQPEAFTLDSSRNSMLTRVRPGSSVQKRIDRVLTRGVEVVEQSLLGTEQLEEGLHPSDHFGLRVDLS